MKYFFSQIFVFEIERSYIVEAGIVKADIYDFVRFS